MKKEQIFILSVEPANKTLNFMGSIDGNLNFEEKLRLVLSFSEAEDAKERNENRMGTSFYFDNISTIMREIRNVKLGKTATRNINR
ncbi:hypothetical protein [Solibacillus sp. R5-41]|uniref:hypothetical protein n=1 Tax=Solibacillus sp. R5-41 TaxID=2048654 RepID=UPI0012FD54CC|nr:hypothetical protein [Solibacillus sp. R5-41]